MVSKLLGDYADSFICLLCPHSWIELGLVVNWKAELRGRLRPSLGRVRAGSVSTQQIPESVSELQSSMALLGAYPYSTVMPQGTCMWDWHTDCIQSVRVHSVCRLTGLSDNIHMLNVRRKSL